MTAAEFDKAIKCKCCGDVATTGFSTRPLCDCCCVELDAGAIPNVVGPLEPVNFAIPYTDPSEVGQFTYGLRDSFNKKCYGSNRCQIVNAGVP